MSKSAHMPGAIMAASVEGGLEALDGRVGG